MQHLSNIFDPRKPETRDAFCGHSYEEWLEGYTGIERAWQRHLDWVNKNVIGPPSATGKYSQQELEDMGMVGIYKKEN